MHVRDTDELCEVFVFGDLAAEVALDLVDPLACGRLDRGFPLELVDSALLDCESNFLLLPFVNTVHDAHK